MDECLPGGRYALAALAALSAIALPSAPVQAREVLTWEIVPDAAAGISAAIIASDSLASEMSRKQFRRFKVKADYFTARYLNHLPHSRFAVVWPEWA